jgi:hypothetical protein
MQLTVQVNSTLLNIDSIQFHQHLKITQTYCHLQSLQKEKRIAEILRTYNPIVKNIQRISGKRIIATLFKQPVSQPTSKPLFAFKHGYRFPDTACTTIWAIDPFDSNTIKKLFQEQLTFKQERIKVGDNNPYEGAILVCHIDQTPVDGAAESESLGFMDGYDLPPIDTWFYLTKHKDKNILFAWIPKYFMQLANDGLLVNCIECFTWFQDTYPEAYETLGL